MMKFLERFKEVWLCDTEYRTKDGDQVPVPVCLVGKEIHSQRIVRLWEDQLAEMKTPPFDIGKDSLFVGYYTPAEFSVFHALGWELPRHVLDLFCESRVATNGMVSPSGKSYPKSLLACLEWYKVGSMGSSFKESMRDIILRGGYSKEEKKLILKYCEDDVRSYERLLPKLEHEFCERSLFLGRYMRTLSKVKYTGIPIDMELFAKLRDKWDEIKGSMIAEVDKNYQVFDGLTFKGKKFEEYLFRQRIYTWPRLKSGSLDLTEDTFKEMAKLHPQLGPLKQLRWSLSQMKLASLAVGADGRNRSNLYSFGSITGRNQPSSSKYIFGMAKWIRSLIKPHEGEAIAYLDFEQQEFGIAAKLSNDDAMMESYASGDPYIQLAIRSGMAPKGATKATHGDVREKFKVVSLGINYGMSAVGLARRLAIPKLEADRLLEAHKRVFHKFWKWSDNTIEKSALYGRLYTPLGWRCSVNSEMKARSLRNWPVQSTGGDVLRLAIILCDERKVRICAPVHDAILITAPSGEIEAAVDRALGAMVDASGIVLSGFKLRAEAQIIKWPNRYEDKDPSSKLMWAAAMKVLENGGPGYKAVGKSKSQFETYSLSRKVLI